MNLTEHWEIPSLFWNNFITYQIFHTQLKNLQCATSVKEFRLHSQGNEQISVWSKICVFRYSNLNHAII